MSYCRALSDPRERVRGDICQFATNHFFWCHQPQAAGTYISRAILVPPKLIWVRFEKPRVQHHPLICWCFPPPPPPEVGILKNTPEVRSISSSSVNNFSARFFISPLACPYHLQGRRKFPPCIRPCQASKAVKSIGQCIVGLGNCSVPQPEE